MPHSKTTRSNGILLLEILLSALVMVMMSIVFCAVYRFFFQAAYPMGFSRQVEEYSAGANLPPSLVYAVIRTESGFKPEAQSDAPARGLMQITQETFEWAQMRLEEGGDLSYDVLFEPDANIRYGTAILKMHMDEFGSVETALCAYHAGRGNVNRWLKDPNISPDGRTIAVIPIRETKHYVSKVLEAQRLYETLYDIY